MSVADGQDVNAAVTNAAYVSRTVDSNTVGRVDLENVVPASGPNVTNTQREINSLNSFTGRPAGSAHDADPVWIDNSVGLSTDSLKDRGEALTTQVSTNVTAIALINNIDPDDIANNQTVFLDIAGFSLDGTVISSSVQNFEIVRQTSTQEILANGSFHLQKLPTGTWRFKGLTWVGDDGTVDASNPAGVELNIRISGTTVFVQYKSDNQTGASYVGKIQLKSNNFPKLV